MQGCAKESGHTHTHTVGDLCADSLPCLLPQVTIGASHEPSERGNKGKGRSANWNGEVVRWELSCERSVQTE